MTAITLTPPNRCAPSRVRWAGLPAHLAPAPHRVAGRPGRRSNTGNGCAQSGHSRPARAALSQIERRPCRDSARGALRLSASHRAA
jgi:hypothetical protein